MNWIKEGTERRSVWPYQFSENIVKATVHATARNFSKQVCSWQHNNWKPLGEGIQDALARWELFAHESGWEEIELVITLSVDDLQSLIETVQPSKDYGLSFAVHVRNSDTRLRRACAVPLNGGQNSITLVLRRNDLKGELLISPLVVLTDDNPAASQGYATRKHSVVASGFPMVVTVDEPMTLPKSGIRIEWETLSDDRAHALYYLTIREDEQVPVILLNKRHAVLEPVVNATEKTGARAKLRNAIFAFIASDIYMQLIRYAVKDQEAEIPTVDEETEESTLSERILRMVARQLKCTQTEIIDSFQNAPAELAVKIQHSLKLGTQQCSMVSEMYAE